MAFVFFSVSGVPNAIAVESGLVTAVEPVPGSLSNPIPQSYVYLVSGGADGERTVVDGTVASVVTALGGGGPPPGSILVAATVFVAPTPIGNDATGVRLSLAQPFATLQAAINVAQPGDTIRLQPGAGYGPAVIPGGLQVSIVGSGPETSIGAVTWPGTAGNALALRDLVVDGVTTLNGSGGVIELANTEHLGPVLPTNVDVTFESCQLTVLNVVDANIDLTNSTVDQLGVSNANPAANSTVFVNGSEITTLLGCTGISPRVFVDAGSAVNAWLASTFQHSTDPGAPPALVHLGQSPSVGAGAVIDWQVPANPLGGFGQYVLNATFVVPAATVPAPVTTLNFVAPAAGPGGAVLFFFGGSPPIQPAVTLSAPTAPDLTVISRGERALPTVTGTGQYNTPYLDLGGIAFAAGPTVVPIGVDLGDNSYAVIITQQTAGDPLVVTLQNNADLTITNPNVGVINANVAIVNN